MVWYTIFKREFKLVVKERNQQMDDISDRQRALLVFIEDYIDANGRPPTNREIGAKLGIPSTGHVNYHLTALEKKGFISREQRTSRGIRVVISLREPEEQMTPRGIMIHGLIAAGEPLAFFRNDEELDLINPAKYASGAYALRVSGESMIEDGIFDGDYVVIEPDVTPHTRDIIVATNTAAGIEGAATLKRFFQESDGVRLQPANKDFEPIFVNARDWNRDWKVQGRVAAVVRPYREN